MSVETPPALTGNEPAANKSGAAAETGVVVIGRNEGQRLRACLQSLRPHALPTVYVDSGSTDGSPGVAEEMGVAVWPLDADRPFTAARARKEGFERLLASSPGLRYVLFVDGDCEVDPEWPAAAAAALDGDDRLAAVCGRRREKHPEASWYNALCDFEWNTPVGGCDSLGGDGVYRVEAYRQAGGFDPSVPAGEEPELCGRLRQAGWRLRRVDAEMTVHDAAITRFGQWWRRQVRTGYGGADVERRFGLGVFDRLIRGAAFWSAAFPATLAVASCAAAIAFRGVGVVAVLALGLAVVLLQVLRIACGARRRGSGWWESLLVGVFTMLAKPAIHFGATVSAIAHRRGQTAKIIEYKGAAPAAGE